MLSAHLSAHYKISRNRQRNLWDAQFIFFWWPRVWLRYSHQMCSFIEFIFWCLNNVIWIKMFCLWWKEWPVVACPFRALFSLFRMLAIFTRYEFINVCDIVSVFFPMMLLLVGSLLEWKGLDMLPWASSIYNLQNKLMIISRSDPGVATDYLAVFEAVGVPLASYTMVIRLYDRLMVSLVALCQFIYIYIIYIYKQCYVLRVFLSVRQLQYYSFGLWLCSSRFYKIAIIFVA